jgi:hypothetical protein
MNLRSVENVVDELAGGFEDRPQQPDGDDHGEEGV